MLFTMAKKERRHTMFGLGGKASQEEKMIKLVKKGDWGSLSNYLEKDSETKVNLSKACATSTSSDCMNILLLLIEEPEIEVKLAAVKSLAAVGTDHETAALQQLLMKTPKENEELRGAITAAVQAMRRKA